MRYIYTVLLLAMALCTSVTTNAQARLSLTTTGVTPAPIRLGDQISIQANLKNESLTDTFRGVVDFQAANKDSLINMPGIFGKPAYAQTGATITLAPQETKPSLFTVALLPARFSIGVDIIIVWPVAAVQIIDSARAPIDIEAPLDIAQLGGDEVKAFAFGEQLFIERSGVKNFRGRVQIYDQMGRVVGDHALSGDAIAIPLHELPAGVYVADIIEENGPGRRLKFVR